MKANGIGNDTFKQWLKNLTPTSRIEQMSAIAKTLLSAGHRGSLIKASLAQLSQRCQVMMIKLTDKEVKDYTRRKTLKRLQDSSGNKQELSLKFKIQAESSQKMKPNCLELVGASNWESSISESPGELSNSLTDSSKTTLINSSKISKSKKRKYKELFGDDLEDLAPPSYQSDTTATNLDAVKQNCVSNYSTTVHVNIYNSSPDHLCIKKASNKKLKIGFGNSKYDSVTKNIDLSLPHQQTSPKYGASNKRKSKKKSSEVKRHKSNKTISHGLDQDLSIKKQWSILGMECPTDRSESIIKSNPFHFTNDKKGADELSVTGKNQTSVESPYSKSMDKSVETHQDLDNLGSENYEVEDSVCNIKISGTFSLATSPVDAFDTLRIQLNEEKDGSNNEIIQSVVKISDKEQHKNTSHILSNVLKLHDEDESNNKTVLLANAKDTDTNDHNSKEPNKVGTIRVKKLGLLMNPELASDLQDPGGAHSTKSSFEDVNITVPNTLQTVQCTQSTNEYQSKEVKKRFILTYKHYFNQFVESQIPKLGDLLHIAIAALVRKEERIKRAQQVFSDDIINDEKHRAEKEFDDMVKTRGKEFLSIFESLLITFDQSSKITLFITLLCRLLKHVISIDPANKNNTIKARDVVRVILSKHQFEDKVILDVLNSQAEQFQSQVDMINNYLANCTESNNEETYVPISKSQVVNNPLTQYTSSASGVTTEVAVNPQSTMLSHSVNVMDAGTISNDRAENSTKIVATDKSTLSVTREPNHLRRSIDKAAENSYSDNKKNSHVIGNLTQTSNLINVHATTVPVPTNSQISMTSRRESSHLNAINGNTVLSNHVPNPKSIIVNSNNTVLLIRDSNQPTEKVSGDFLSANVTDSGEVSSNFVVNTTNISTRVHATATASNPQNTFTPSSLGEANSVTQSVSKNIISSNYIVGRTIPQATSIQIPNTNPSMISVISVPYSTIAKKQQEWNLANNVQLQQVQSSVGKQQQEMFMTNNVQLKQVQSTIGKKQQEMLMVNNVQLKQVQSTIGKKQQGMLIANNIQLKQVQSSMSKQQQEMLLANNVQLKQVQSPMGLQTSNMLPPTNISSPSIVESQYVQNQTSSYQIVNSSTPQECFRNIAPKPSYSYRANTVKQQPTITNSLTEKRQTAVTRKQLQPANFVVENDSSAAIGGHPNNLSFTLNNIQANIQKTVVTESSMNGNFLNSYQSTSTTETVSTARIVGNVLCVDPLSPRLNDGTITLAGLLGKVDSSQAPLPSSSHCHPFDTRMPISGKFRMLFGNSNSSS